jgi:hypothetical protein
VLEDNRGGEGLSVSVKGVDEVVRKMNRLASMDGAKRGIAAGAALLKAKMADYPPPNPKPQPFKSDKQRRFVMAALREGRLGFPYKRTGKLGQGWTVTFTSGGLGAVVGNSVAHGPLVQKAGEQAGYHSGNWQTEAQVAEEFGPDVIELIEAEIKADING